MLLHEVRLTRRLHADRHVRLSHRKVQLRVRHQQAHPDFGIVVEEIADLTGEPHRAEAHGRRDAERPARLFPAFREHRLGDREFGEHFARRAQQQLPLFGRQQAARMAMEQRRAEGVLQGADLPAHRRLTQVQHVAAARETAGVGDDVENPQLVPVHAGYPAAPADASQRSASSAAMQPVAAAVTAWRYVLSCTSPAAKTPARLVAVLSGAVTI